MDTGTTARLPTFLIIGAMRSGTTTLQHHLRCHPDIFMPDGEPSFFLTQGGARKRLKEYGRLFERSDRAVVVGEKCARYADATTFRGVPRRIANALPDIRLIYLLRHPIDRMVSQYYVEGVKFGERRPIDQAIHDPKIFGPSLYSFQVEKFLRRFSREQILLLTTEDLRDHTAQTLRTVFEFLGASPERVSPELGVALNRRGDVRGFSAHLRAGEVDPSTQVLSPESRERLIQRLEPDLARLPQHVGRPFDCWSLLQ